MLWMLMLALSCADVDESGAVTEAATIETETLTCTEDPTYAIIPDHDSIPVVMECYDEIEDGTNYGRCSMPTWEILKWTSELKISCSVGSTLTVKWM